MLTRKKYRNTTDYLIYLLYVLTSVAFLVTRGMQPYPLAYLVKILPLAVLAFAVVQIVPFNKGRLILLALFFSATGDVFLNLSDNKYFVYGLASFGIAHCFYIASFLRKIELKKIRSFFALLLVVYGILLLYALIPKVGQMTLPIVAYVLIIISMAISAVLGKENHYLTILGSFFFVISDSIIAFNKYLFKVPQAGLLIMITYYLAQFLIIFGVIKSVKNNIQKHT